LFHATRGKLLQDLGRPDEAVQAYRAALALTSNPAEQALLERRLKGSKN
jgi:RNA polymerase sigma-70 factor (ECF subfamily)